VTQLPSPQRRFPIAHHVKRVRPKTYSIAVYLVVGIVVLQVLMLISVFWLRAMVVSVNVHLPKALPSKTNAQPPASQELIGPQPPKIPAPLPAVATIAMPRLPSITLPSTHAALLSVPSASDPLAQIVSLNEEAQEFLNQHVLESALDTLLRAEDIDPRHPDTLKNLAETYNLMNDLPRSKMYWQRLVDIGPAVGTIYGVAQDHILLLGGREASPLADPSPLPRQIYVDSAEKTPAETINGQAQFHLRATLMRKNARMPSFDQKKLQPYVIFYQQMPDGSLVPDLGQHKGSFDDTFLFWGGKEEETFGVDYLMPLPGTMSANGTPQGTYYGFVIGIYYNKVLQDARSEPSDLISRIPLPDEIE